MAFTRRKVLRTGLLGTLGLTSGAMAADQQKPKPDIQSDVFSDLPIIIETSKLQRARSATVEIFREDPRRRSHANRRKGYGSGFLYARDDLLKKASFTEGTLVVTNQHVVDLATEVWVRRLDGLVSKADVIVANSETDLAILRVDYDDRPHTLKLARTQPTFGDPVFAIGSPYGYAGTVTRGHVTGEAVPYRDDDPVDYLQHDAIINHGSSGGPLLDRHGEVVGVNTAIPDFGQSFFGIALSTPTPLIVKELSKVMFDKWQRPWLGLRFQQISPELEEALGWNDRAGLLIADVDTDSPAAAAGLAVGDILTGAENLRFNSIRDFGKMMLAKMAGEDLLRVTFHRLKAGAVMGDESVIDAIPLVVRKSYPISTQTPANSTIRVVPTTGISVSAKKDGACTISGIVADSVAELAGLNVGDSLDLFDMQPCRSTAQLDRLWAQTKKKNVPVLVSRGGQRPLFLTLPRYRDETEIGLTGNSTLEISKAY